MLTEKIRLLREVEASSGFDTRSQCRSCEPIDLNGLAGRAIRRFHVGKVCKGKQGHSGSVSGCWLVIPPSKKTRWTKGSSPGNDCCEARLWRDYRKNIQLNQKVVFLVWFRDACFFQNHQCGKYLADMSGTWIPIMVKTSHFSIFLSVCVAFCLYRSRFLSLTL